MSSDTPQTDAAWEQSADLQKRYDLCLKLERENAELRQQLVERDALLAELTEPLDETACYILGRMDDLTPSTALAEHDAEVRWKALEEAATICEEFATIEGIAQQCAEAIRIVAKEG